jgi:hypothetical protein
MAVALRPLSTGELLDRVFSLYRAHFALFVGIVALPHLITLALQLFVGARLSPPGFGISAMLGTFLWAMLLGLAALVVGSASQAAAVVAVSQVYLERPTSVGDAFFRVKGRIAVVLLLTFVMGLAIGLGFLFLIVPGILLALMWSLAIPVAVLEGKGIGDSMSRSAELTKGHRPRIFVIWLLFIILSVAVTALLQWPITLVVAMLTRGNPGAMLTWVQTVSAVMTFISQSLVGPLATIAFSLVYYDERVRKEAFDLQLMMATLDGAPPAAAPSV